MSLQYTRYPIARRIEEYVGQAGDEAGGLALPSFAYEAIAESKVTGRPCQYVVIGEYRGHGKRHLDLGVTREWIEARTNFRADESGQLRWTCPECGRVGGGHARQCKYES